MGHKSPGTSVTEVRIVEAAAQLFAHNGFKGTTTRDIAQLADLNEATLFRYFPAQAGVVLGCGEIARGAGEAGPGHADQPRVR
jgi:AcrR family transcriptional regulator